MAPNIVTIRPGVQFEPAAAASFVKAEAALGRQIDVNSTYRDWDKQLSMYNAWNAYVAWRGPYPGHSRAIHPKYSKHCLGLALDSDDWTRPGFIAFMANRGWIRTAANDPTERHHFEYQEWMDKHKGDPMPAGKDEDEMTISDIYKEFRKTGGQPVPAGADYYFHINDERHTSVVNGPVKSVVGNLSVEIKAEIGTVIQVFPVVATVADGKKDVINSLRAQEVIGTSGNTYDKIPVNCALDRGQRLRFRIKPDKDIVIVSAVFRGTAFN